MALLISFVATLIIVGFIEFDDYCKRQWMEEDYEIFLTEGTGHD